MNRYKHAMKRVFAFWLALALVSWAAWTCRETDSPDRPAADGLHQTYARFRAERISQVGYDLSFRLDESDESYSGTSTVAFDWNGAGDPLTVDFTGGTVKAVRVNGKDFAEYVYNDFFIALPAGALAAGRNEIQVDFEHPYSRNSDGLYRFRDPADDRVYLFTDFEPYRANFLFPCFDQPDLKADYALSVDVPAGWQVVSGVRESKVETTSSGRRLWRFERGRRYSTYIFALHAGDYAFHESTARRAPSGEPGLTETIPLRLYYRQSMAPFVDHVEWFRITRQGLAFFQEYFDYPYPYQKYDQLLVPDFNIGAMENVGAVTFNERYAPRGKPTYTLREKRANVILHEMAHMWFGNLVTMRWWDDLWLNESFATYMAYLALDRATEYRTAWRSFFTRTKQWAYHEDGLVTTHPIVGAVPDTATAFVNFDGITYGKGAASLKQLAFFLGPEAFREGVRNYIREFAGSNTIKDDFVKSLALAADLDLDDWSEDWLHRAGTNTIAARFSCDGEFLREIHMDQSAPEDHDTIREHYSLLALFGRDPRSGAIILDRLIPAPATGATTVVPLPEEATPCPLAIFPNYEDHDFSRARLDATSLGLFLKEWRNIRDPFARSQIWQSLYHMMRAGELPIQDLVRLTLDGLPAEEDLIIAGQITYYATDLLYYLGAPPATQQAATDGSGVSNPASGAVPGAAELSTELQNVFLEKLQGAPAASPAQKLWLIAYVNVARSPRHLSYLLQLLKGDRRLPGLTLDQDRRWMIVGRLARAGHPEANHLLEAEQAADSSERGAKSALSALVSRPDPKIKQEWFEKVTATESDLSLARQRIVMGSLFPRPQQELQRPFARSFLTELLTLIESKDEIFLRSFIRLAPTFCEEESVRMLGEFNEEHPDLPPVVKKGLLAAHQEDGRCVAIRARARAGASETK